jgi:hypothetical protein
MKFDELHKVLAFLLLLTVTTITSGFAWYMASQNTAQWTAIKELRKSVEAEH